jgi:N-acetylglucosaminyldiphosphoundecaprenol N-acetyl-beta-D-mannosaminyltransferase
MQNLVKTSLLGVGITNENKENILEYIIAQAKKGQDKCMIVTPNPEMVVYAQRHPDFAKILNEAEVALCDGVGLFLASKIMARPIKERITGVDLVKSLCENSVKNGLSIGFLGGRQNVAEEASKCLKQLYPDLKVVFVAEEWPSRERRGRSYELGGKNKKEEIIPHTSTPSLQLVPQRKIDILFVAFGAPKQEEWIAANLDTIPVTVAMGVGGAFDYLSGRVPRAPRPIRTMGMEWLYRLVRQPWRWRRQLALLSFVGLVVKDRVVRKVS